MKNLLLILLIGISGFISAQFHFSFTHYTSDNGLSQNSITAMMKDRNGYIWFGTRDGLNKFDGYNFTIFNSKADKRQSLLSNRIIDIKEDRLGYIWMKTYDDIVCRLDPSTEELKKIEMPDGNFINDKIQEIFTLPSGNIWLNTFNKGCYKIITNPENGQLHVSKFDVAHKTLPDDIVKNIFEDEEKNTWILTFKGLMQIKSGGVQKLFYANIPFYSFINQKRRILLGSDSKVFLYDKRNKTFKTIELQEKGMVSSIAFLPANKYLFATPDNGFYAYDLLSESLQHFSTKKFPQMKTDEILQIYIDRSGEAWISIHASGILHYIPQKNKLEYIETRLNEGQVTNPSNQIFEDEKDNLWIQPYVGTFSWFDRVTDRLVPFYSPYNEDVNTLFSYGVNHVLSDSQGVLWISTNRGNGVFKCTFLPDYFNHYLFQNQSVYSISNETRAIFEDNQRRLWVATKDGAVHVFDENVKPLGTLNEDGRIFQGGKLEILVYNFFQDKKGDIWLATKKRGLFRLISTNNKNSFHIENFVHSADPFSPGNNDFYSVTQDKQGRIWAGSYGAGLHLIDESTGKIRFIHAYNLLKSYPITNCSKVRQVYVDTKQQIWVATTEGFVVFNSNLKSPKDIKFQYYHKNEDDPNSLGTNDVHCILDDGTSMWFGTFGGGLNRLKSKLTPGKQPQFDVYRRTQGMPNNVVYTIIDDKQGNLWLTTENSIVKFNKNTAKIESFGKGNELENVEFSEASACMLQSSEICVGSKSGFYWFNPDAVKRQVIRAPLVFTGLLLFNKEVEIGVKGSILQKQIDYQKTLVFNHNQNVFSIEFATLDMRAPEKIQYAYKLDGFDPDWNYVHTKHFATYTSLPPGKYTFRVRSTDSEGIWLNNERQLIVKILPSFWQSNFAKFLYILFGIGLFVIAFYIFATFLKLKNNVVLEKHITDMKLRFFTDISHELRTPLTLISLPVDNILKENLDPGIKEQMHLIRRNLDRVLSLINQILDFRKIQNNKMRLTVEEISFGYFVKASCSNFNEIANAKNIKFQVIDSTDGLKVWVDPERLDSIIYNLLSNSFKFTSPGKKITVRTTNENNKAILYVQDEGIGIAKEKINFIFDRFFSSNTLRNITQKSTGIGLDLVKNLVDLHHADIQVESEPGKGTSFRLVFQLGTSHFDQNVDIIISDATTSDQNEILPENELSTNEKSKPIMLLVEDNEELRHFLKSSLKVEFKVEEAENGLIAWKKLDKIQPDIIITDLRMPEMDGLEFTQKLKTDPRTSHIPVILLTAVTDMENKVAGMKVGADDYITKPFSSEYLHARIENLMALRQQLQLHYRSQIAASSKLDFKLPPLEIKSQEEIFMQRLIELMNENIDNFELNIDYLASELGMSRTVFFNKLKSLTGYSPVEFVREVRFERAAEYMRNTKLSVSEISYQIGIEDPRYFSRCFKQKFGITPSEYRTQFENETENSQL